jgi:hypothetical protein
LLKTAESFAAYNTDWPAMTKEDVLINLLKLLQDEKEPEV